MKMIFMMMALLGAFSTAMASEIKCLGSREESGELYLLKISKQNVEIYYSDDSSNPASLYAKGIMLGKLLPKEVCNSRLTLDDGSSVQAVLQRGTNAFEGVIGFKSPGVKIFFSDCF